LLVEGLNQSRDMRVVLPMFLYPCLSALPSRATTAALTWGARAKASSRVLMLDSETEEQHDPHIRLLKVVLSRLPPGAEVSRGQLRSMMGLSSNEVWGCSLKALPGSFDAAVHTLMDADGRGALHVPQTAGEWATAAPPPTPSTLWVGEVAGAKTWLTNEPDRVDELLRLSGLAEAPAVGFDLEWTPTMVRGQQLRIGLLQLATRECCLLVRIGQMARPLPPALSAMLAADVPVKVGRGVAADANRLECDGCLVGSVDELKGRDSLKDAARKVARLELTDGGSAFTNWDASELSIEALRYAAFDAIAAAHVYDVQGGRGVQAPKARRGAARKRTQARKARGRTPP